jgi:glycerophosphoryl diester phosphodiesterase
MNQGVFVVDGTVVIRPLTRNGFPMEITGDLLERVRVIGHRGWPILYPDNVLAGILAAAEVADMVEVDIRATSDGTLVLSHDPYLGGKVIAETPWSELADLDVGDGYRPLDLTGLMAALPTFPINLEIKNLPNEPGFDPEHGVALRTAEAARRGDLLSCFYWPAMDAVRAERPAVATGLLVDQGWSLADAVDHAIARGHVAVIPQFELALSSEAVIRSASEAGLLVAVWTLNDPLVACQLAMMGVTAIITDDPGYMKRELKEHL